MSMKGKKYIWNKKKNCLEEYTPPPEWYTPISHDPDLFKRGLCEIREQLGRGSKKQGFRVSKERNERR
jgi:hypothetical protein